MLFLTFFSAFFMNIIRQIMGMPKKSQESTRKVTTGTGVVSTGTQKRPATRITVAREKSILMALDTSSNGTRRRPSTRSSVAKEESITKSMNSEPEIQPEEPMNPEPLLQTESVEAEVVSEETASSGSEGTENSSSEGLSSESIAVEKAMRTTSSFSAKEKGKAKVEEETHELGEAVQKPAPEAVIKYHLQWDGNVSVEDAIEGEEEDDDYCIICDQDLGSSPGDENGYDDEDEYGYENSNLPEVGVLGCGHCFHSQCLESITPDDLFANPPCLICLS